MNYAQRHKTLRRVRTRGRPEDVGRVPSRGGTSVVLYNSRSDEFHSIRNAILKSFVFLRKLSGAGVRAFPQSSVPSVCSRSSYHPWSKLFAFLCVPSRPKNPCQSVFLRAFVSL